MVYTSACIFSLCVIYVRIDFICRPYICVRAILLAVLPFKLFGLCSLLLYNAEIRLQSRRV